MESSIKEFYMSEKQKIKVIYIVGSGRSGSTILDRILSSSPKIFSVGEFKTLKQYIDRRDEKRPKKNPHNYKTTSGVSISEDSFWSDLAKMIKEDDIRIYDKNMEIDRFRIILKIIFKRKLRINPFNDGKIYGHILTKAKKEKNETVDYILDSSKDFKRLLYLWASDNVDLYVIHNIRDARGQISSCSKRGFDWLKFFFEWLFLNITASIFLKNYIDEDRRVTLSYDMFAKKPEKYLKKLNEKFNLDLDVKNYIDKVRKEKYYSFSGNGKVKNYDFKGVVYEKKWKKRMPVWKNFIIGILAFIPNRIWVYGRKR